MTNLSGLRGRPLAAVAALVTITMVPALSLLPATAATLPSAVSTAPGARTLGDPVTGLSDVNLQGSAAPTAAQKQAADSLGKVDLRWNDLGTPASILPRSGSLGSAPGEPAAAARTWLSAHATLLGLTAEQVADLKHLSSQKLAGSKARAVIFRQEFGGVPAATGGLVTVGLANGRVHYVSSSLTRATTSSVPAATLTPLQGWLAAAKDVGRTVPAGDLAKITSRVADGWTRLAVPGFAQAQLVRPRALGMADGSVRPVFEANVVDVSNGDAAAYTVLVDAASGKVLVRRNQVDNAVYNNVFTGTITGTQCGPQHSFELNDANTKQINAIATALPVDDVVVKFYGPSGLLQTSDLLTSPEVASYNNPAGMPAGTYAVQVCPFDPASAVVGSYALTVSTNDNGTPAPGGQPSPVWRFFPANPTLDSPSQTPTNSVIGCWILPDSRCNLPTGELRNIAATAPWDALADGTPTFTTVGNNANTHEAWGSPLTPGGAAQAPYSPTREYTTEFTDAWNNSECDPSELRPGGNDIDASVTNLFVAHNRMHDYSYYLGFTEDNYNLQLDNMGRGGVDGDQEVGNAQAGAVTGGSPSYLGRDNANQITLQDGVPGITNQYLFQPIAGAFYAPCTDGGMDMGIVGHEYTHAISNRMVGGPDDGLTSEQGGAMGESWGDLVAGEYMFSHGYANGGNPWAVGVYATGNKQVAIRDYSIDNNPLNYSDYGFDLTGPEVHADGEIWNGTMWEVRQALVEKYNSAYPYNDKALQLRCAQATRGASPLAADQCPGNRRWVQLVFDAFLLQQGNTSMLDARDAMIAADRMRFGGADEKALWAAFARRGMGRDASTPSPDSDEVTPSFIAPGTRNSKVVFRAPTAGSIYVGDYEARVTPVADTDGATALGKFAYFAPGTYRMLFVSAKNGFRRFTMTVPEGGTTQDLRIGGTPNLASAASGATVISATPGSIKPESLIDGTEATNWGGVTAGDVDASNPSVSVDLAGGTSTISRVQVSAMLTPASDVDPDSGSRFTALRQFAIEVCTTDCSAPSATWSRAYTSGPNAFPAVQPRPVAPNLTMRNFVLANPVQAAAVRLVVLDNQCTGFAGYAGEQDADPLNDTDCKSASDRGRIVHAAELQVFTK